MIHWRKMNNHHNVFLETTKQLVKSLSAVTARKMSPFFLIHPSIFIDFFLTFTSGRSTEPKANSSEENFSSLPRITLRDNGIVAPVSFANKMYPYKDLGFP